ncbi:MAG: GtrA family protein [Terriglobales bacterium]
MTEAARRDDWKTLGRRWLKFNFVGALGIGVQLAALAALTALGLGYLAATALAVEAAVVHNFLWHERMTWRDRATPLFRHLLGRFVRFQMANGAISLIGNLVVMRLLVGAVHLPVLWANLGAIASCAALNFVVSDRLVFTTSRAQRGSPMPSKCPGNR